MTIDVSVERVIPLPPEQVAEYAMDWRHDAEWTQGIRTAEPRAGLLRVGESDLQRRPAAVLGLLSVRRWSTYELTRQMDRRLGRIWPRAQSKLYEEPKKLVGLGLARSAGEPVGGRPRTVYEITEAGRRALAAWLRVPGSGPVLESEQLLQIFFADSGTRSDALATLTAARAWEAERNQENLAAARAYLTGQAPFPERAAQTLPVGRFLTEYYRLVAEWADWATALVGQWPDDPRDAVADPRRQAETARRAAPPTRSARTSARLRADGRGCHAAGPGCPAAVGRTRATGPAVRRRGPAPES
jgi:DNA-binding PadR family transcriptional regulator